MSDSESHETVSQQTREDVLERDRHRCRICGSKGIEKDGVAELQVHHIQRDPDELDEHDLDNLTTLCRGCHSWHHQQTTDNELPVELIEADKAELRKQDYLILRRLDELGPTTPRAIADSLPFEATDISVRERLWKLMALVNIVEDRDEKIVDQDAETGKWGLAGQIANSRRGRIPDDIQTLLQRAEEERVRRALANGCDRESVAKVFDIAERTVWHKEYRALAYDFPLEALEDSRGRPSKSDDTSADQSASEPPAADDDQQQLDAIADGSGEDESQSAGDADEQGEVESETDRSQSEDDDTVSTHVQDAISSLQALETALSSD